MVTCSPLLALLSTLVVARTAEDYVCGASKKDLEKSQRGASLSSNTGVPTNPLEMPWLVQLVYADKKRACAGTLITDRHVLTARQCVDGVKPKDISVIYGPRTPYGGNASVKSAKSPSDANADLAVLELSKAVELAETTIPVCVAASLDDDDKAYNEYKGLHYGPKNKPQESELARAMYQDVLKRADEKECIKALGKNCHKGTQFCVGKRNLVFVEGVYAGGPILALHSSGRFLQVGIALRADAENNYGSATRVAMYQKDIGELAGRKLPSIDNKSPPSPPPRGPVRDSKFPRLVSLPEKLTYEDAEEACLKLRGTVAAPTEPHFAEHLK
ncbi:proclotting enzyme-like protein, partial [Aphelenchoides avenae]